MKQKPNEVVTVPPWTFCELKLVLEPLPNAAIAPNEPWRWLKLVFWAAKLDCCEPGKNPPPPNPPNWAFITFKLSAVATINEQMLKLIEAIFPQKRGVYEFQVNG